MTAKNTTRFHNYPQGYAERQLRKLRALRLGQQQPDTRLAALETFNDYVERQRVGETRTIPREILHARMAAVSKRTQ